MYHKIIGIVVCLACVVTGCNLLPPTLAPTLMPTMAPTLEFAEPTQPIIIITSTPPSIQQAVLDRAAEVIALLRDKDMTSLAGYVHSKWGLRFSPYASVKETDQVILAENIPNLRADKRLYTWGNYSGSGEPIDLSFEEYYSEFIFDVDFANAPEIALNHRLGVSTSMDNIFEFYQSSMFVEYYFPSFDPQFEGMDWRSLRLVFMRDNDTWYLVGIIHDQWTT